MTLYRKDGPSGGEGGANAGPRLPEGAVLAGRYRVERWLGAGGMGAVYEVFDQVLDEAIALKLLHPELSEDDEHRQRLRGEVKLARRVSHPNVCRVHDLGEHDGQLFVTMELIRGATLRRTIRGRREPLPVPRRIDIIVQVCSALAAAHRAGVLHRDVKPDNVILERDRIALTDFGVAGMVAELAQSRRLVAGTPAYIAPEVLRGERYDQRVDIYACGVVAYELLAGQQPYSTPSLDAAIQRARTRPALPPLPPTLAEPEVVALLDQALARALEFDAALRTRSVDAFAEEIAHAIRGHRPGASAGAPRMVAGAGVPNAPTVTGEAAQMHGAMPGDMHGAMPGAMIDQPTLTAASVPVGGAPATREPTTGRAQIRVATALAFACDHELELPPADEATSRTQPLTLLSAGDRLERIVVDLGGTPLEISGNGVTALFGAPVALGDDAARAARAAHALLEASSAGRAGIDTGRLLYRRTRSGPSATGDALDRARALLEAATEGQVLASPPAARQLAGRFQVSELSSGRTDAADGRALVIHPGTIERPEAHQDLLPMLGRARELARLEALVQRACETREPHWASVIGPAGYGKSRLRQELTRKTGERREVDWLLGRATPLGEVAPLSLLRSADASWFEAATRGGLHDRTEAFEAARLWLEERASRRPVVVLFEDAQWADDASLELCDHLARELDRVPVTVILFGRGEGPAGLGRTASGERQLVVQIGPIDERTAIELARRIAPAASDDELVELARRAGGNPFFVEELARDLRERGQSRQGDATGTTVTPLPATVEAVVQGRLDRLPARTREVACAAAVVGREFWREAARACLPDPAATDEAELDGALAELEHRAIVSPLPPTTVDDERYVFSSALVRDVAYQQLAPRDRRRAHAAVARWLEPRVGPASSADPAILAAIAAHRDAAGDAEGACEAYQEAGKRSMALFAYKESASALRRARALTEEPPIDLLLPLAEALLQSDSIEAGEAVYQEALVRAHGDPLAEGRILDKLSTCATRRADNAAAIDYCRKGLAILAPDGEPTDAARVDPTVLAALYGSLAWQLGYVRTDNEAGLEYGERAVALLEDTPHKRELARALSRLGANYMRAGRWADQLACNRRNLELAEQLGELEMQLTAHINLGVTYSSMGQYEEAAAHTRRALDLTRKTHAVTTRALVHSNLGGWLLELGRLDEASDHLATAADLAERGANRRFLPECFGFAARIALARGNLRDAEVKARRAVALATDDSVTIDEGIAARILAGVLALSGAMDEAEELLERSQRCLADADAYESARTTAQTARFLALRRREGDAARAAELRQQAREVFERLGARRDLERLDDDREVR